MAKLNLKSDPIVSRLVIGRRTLRAVHRSGKLTIAKGRDSSLGFRASKVKSGLPLCELESLWRQWANQAGVGATVERLDLTVGEFATWTCGQNHKHSRSCRLSLLDGKSLCDTCGAKEGKGAGCGSCAQLALDRGEVEYGKS